MGESTKILLIEDNPGDARIVKEELSEEIDFLFELLIADRLSFGIDLIKSENIDLVLLDLSLPDSNGLNTFLEINKTVKNIPIVILSGNRDEDVARSAVIQGAHDYLVKGEIDSTILVKTIRNALQKQRDKEKLEKLTDTITNSSLEELVILTDINGVILFTNEGFKKTTGHNDVIGKNINILKSDKHESNFFKIMWATILSGEVFEGVFINKNSYGNHYIEQKIITPIKNKDGEITHFISCGKNLSSLISLKADLNSAEV
jgi:PAS domain S-box-containing protein